MTSKNRFAVLPTVPSPRIASFCMLVSILIILPFSARADLDVSKKATHDVTCSGGICTATAKNANLNVSDLTDMLAAGDTTVKFGGGALAIQVEDGFSWTTTSRLTLDANTSAGFHKPVTVAGQGALTITYNDGGTGGDLKFFDTGKIDFWDTGSSLIINGNSYMLVGDIKTLADDIYSKKGRGSYALANDYDAKGDGTYDGSPVDTLFLGQFEGLGHLISNLTIDRGYGMFASSEGIIRDLRLLKTLVNGKKDRAAGGLVGRNDGALVGDSVDAILSNRHVLYAGGLTGESTGAGVIVRCSSSGEVVGKNVGGLVGESFGSIDSSSSSARVTGYSNGDQFTAAGGLVGVSVGPIFYSHATGSVQSTVSVAGGLVGENDNTIVSSYATGTAASPVAAGGLAGENGGESTIRGSWSSGFVTGSNWGGGLAGISLDGFIVDSYATGSVSLDYGDAGGLVGVTTGNSVSTSYSTGTVSVQNLSGSYIGGLIGASGSDVFSYGYWDLDTSGVSDPSQGVGNIPKDPGITGLRDRQLKRRIPNGFDPQVWGQDPDIDNGYPYLLANPPPQ